MENKKETTIVLGYIGITLGVILGFLGIVEKTMETTIVWGYIGIILGVISGS